jgi:hypothetical protein
MLWLAILIVVARNGYGSIFIVNCIGVRKRFFQTGANLFKIHRYVVFWMQLATLPTCLPSKSPPKFYKLNVLLGPQLLKSTNALYL